MALPIIAAGVVGPVAAKFIQFFVGSFIAKVVVAFGISFISYAAMTAVANSIEARIISNVGGLGGQFANIASALGLFQAINIIASAYVGAITVRQIMGAYNRMTFSGGST